MCVKEKEGKMPVKRGVMNKYNNLRFTFFVYAVLIKQPKDQKLLFVKQAIVSFK